MSPSLICVIMLLLMVLNVNNMRCAIYWDSQPLFWVALLAFGTCLSAFLINPFKMLG